MSKTLIIFDCDGVLVDSEFVSSRVFSEAVSEYGFTISTEDCIKRFTGLCEKDCRQAIMEESGIEIPNNYWSLLQPVLKKAYETELTALLHPVLEILDSLGISRCVASNSSRNHVVECLEHTKQLKFFSDDTIFTSQQVPRAKPAPDLFLFAAEEMGFSPKDCIVIEDSSTGANAAIAAGMKVLMYVGGSHAHFEWYRSKVSVHGKPIMSNCHELSNAIKQAIEAKVT
ncbi:MAG: HAD-IA family hydrolase [Parachlamydiaceae bacterium]|nr:HAD-IA family hydrolase [Parachlamydiaceae bacterium]